MKHINITFYSLVFFAASLLFTSCTKKEDPTPSTNESLQLTTVFSNSTHTIEFYTTNGKFQTGYNDLYFRIKNLDGTYVNTATINWQPVMYMTGMEHSCPKSSITKKSDNPSLYGGYMIFQMASSDAEYWELTLEYSIDGVEYSISSKINVEAASDQVVQSFLGSDNKRYVVALIEPSKPGVGTNNIKAALFNMESMMNFTAVNNYKIKIDPRMPGMGNHSSPNNLDLTQAENGIYNGKLNLTMTGYWKINLQIEDAASTIIKGEVVTPTNESSSIYFEVEF